MKRLRGSVFGPAAVFAILACDSSTPKAVDALTSDQGDATDAVVTEIPTTPGRACIEIEPDQLEFWFGCGVQQRELLVAIGSCGTGPLSVFEIRLVQDTEAIEIDFSRLPTGIAPTRQTPIYLSPGDEIEFGVVIRPTKLQLPDMPNVIVSNDSEQPSISIPVRAYVVEPECPFPIIQVTDGTSPSVGVSISLSGEKSCPASGAIRSYQWTVRRPPIEASTPMLISIEPTATDLLDREGTTQYCLDICDAQFCSTDPQCHTTTCREVEVGAAR